MKNHQEPDWEKLISDTIESALHSGDFTQLKQTLGTTFETVKKQTAEGLKRIDVQTEKIFTQAQGRQQTNPQQVRQSPPQPAMQRVPSRYATDWQRPSNRVQPKQKAMKLPNKKAAVIGVFAGLFFGVCFLQGAYQSVTDLFSLPFKFSMITSLLMLLLMTAASFWLAAHCIGKFRKRRYLQYLLAIGTRQVCAIDVLAKAVNKSTKFVIRDLKSMIKTGLFPQGHLDAENTCLILTDEAYGQYRVGQANRKQRELEEAKIQENPNGLEAVIAEGRGWVPQDPGSQRCPTWSGNFRKTSPTGNGHRENLCLCGKASGKTAGNPPVYELLSTHHRKAGDILPGIRKSAGTGRKYPQYQTGNS